MIGQKNVFLAISILLLASWPVKAQQKGDTLAVVQINPPGVTRASDASLLVVIDDPHLITGHGYRVVVTRVADDTAHWELTDMSSGMKKGSSYCTAKDTVPRWMIADGLRMHLTISCLNSRRAQTPRRSSVSFRCWNTCRVRRRMGLAPARGN